MFIIIIRFPASFVNPLDSPHPKYYNHCNRETLNKSSAAGQRIFCPQSAVWKTGNIAQPLPAKLAYGCGIPLAGTYSIPTFSKPCLRTKSLAASSCRFNQSFHRIAAGRVICENIGPGYWDNIHLCRAFEAVFGCPLILSSCEEEAAAGAAMYAARHEKRGCLTKDSGGSK